MFFPSIVDTATGSPVVVLEVCIEIGQYVLEKELQQHAVSSHDRLTNNTYNLIFKNQMHPKCICSNNH